jgi:hypothetical protein
LIKVMMEIPIVEGDDTRSIILSFAEQIAGWTNHARDATGRLSGQK